MPGQENLNCNWQIAEGSGPAAPAGRAPNHRGAPTPIRMHVCEFYLQELNKILTVDIREKKFSQAYGSKRRKGTILIYEVYLENVQPLLI